MQVSTLLYTHGKKAAQVFCTLCFEVGEDDEDYYMVLEKLNSYFVPKVNVIHERARFYLCSQKKVEFAEEYILMLSELAETCQFGPAKISDATPRWTLFHIVKSLCTCGE